MHECPRCKKICKQKIHLRKHFNRKKPCVVSNLEVSIETCKIRLEQGKFKKELSPIEHKCKFCHQIFDRHLRLKNHYKLCKVVIYKNLLVKQEEIVPKSKTHNFVYILQEREFVKSGEPIYKIGKTTRPTERIKGYPKGSIMYLNVPCENCNEKEKELIKIFDKKFKQCVDIGREYYEGDLKEMIKEIIKAV